MEIMKCSGQDTVYWKPEAIFDAKCPECGEKVEFFNDDTTRKCPNCGHRLINFEMDFGFVSYSRFAEQCAGLPGILSKAMENSAYSTRQSGYKQQGQNH